MTLLERINKLLYPRRPELTFISELYGVKIYADGRREDLGLLSRRVVTDAGVAYMVQSFINSTTSPLSNFKYHASGTGTNAEAVGNTALQTEVATRVAGTQVQGSGANVYQTVATIPYTGTLAITEHGLLSAASTGTLWDRSVFSAQNMVNGESIQFTYNLTINSGG